MALLDAAHRRCFFYVLWKHPFWASASIVAVVMGLRVGSKNQAQSAARVPELAAVAADCVGRPSDGERDVDDPQSRLDRQRDSLDERARSRSADRARQERHLMELVCLFDQTFDAPQLRPLVGSQLEQSPAARLRAAIERLDPAKQRMLREHWDIDGIAALAAHVNEKDFAVDLAHGAVDAAQHGRYTSAILLAGLAKTHGSSSASTLLDGMTGANAGVANEFRIARFGDALNPIDTLLPGPLAVKDAYDDAASVAAVPIASWGSAAVTRRATAQREAKWADWVRKRPLVTLPGMSAGPTTRLDQPFRMTAPLGDANELQAQPGRHRVNNLPFNLRLPPDIKPSPGPAFDITFDAR